MSPDEKPPSPVPQSPVKVAVELVILFVVVLGSVVIWKASAERSAAPSQGIADLGTDALTSPSGLRWRDMAPGAGPSPKSGQRVIVHYTGRLTDGTVFDASRRHGDVFRFRLGMGEVIKGWDEGVASMKVGGVRRLVVPPELGYGKQGSGEIPPDATLVFDIELLGFE